MTTTPTKEFTLPFVGREEELQFLLNEYDQMLHAHYRSAWLEAPAGVGKTTLVEEFLKRIDVVPHNGTTSPPWIVHAHLRERSSNSLASFVEALGATLQLLTEQQREKLFSGLTSFYEERAKKIVGGGNVQSMDMEEAITTAGYIFKRLSYYFPLVVIIEDVHVLKGEMSFYALRHLLAIIEHVPMLTLFISRPSEEKNLKQFHDQLLKEGCKKYEVKNLKSDDVEILVGAESPRLAPARIKELMHLSGGNALLLRELLRSNVSHPAHSSKSPTENIIHYLSDELEKLPKRDRQIIAIAGMLGEEFSEILLEEIAENKKFNCWSEDVLERLEHKGILNRRKKTITPKDGKREISLRVSIFSHALWWEAARKLYKKEKQWTDKKFSEAIAPLLSYEDYPLLTDAELIVNLLRSIPTKFRIHLLEYIDGIASLEASWHFHSDEEQRIILSEVRRCIMKLVANADENISKKHIWIFVRLLNAEQFVIGALGKDYPTWKKNNELEKKLLKPLLRFDDDAFVYTLERIEAETENLRSRKEIKKLKRELVSLRIFLRGKNAEKRKEYYEAFWHWFTGYNERYQYPELAAKELLISVEKSPWNEYIGRNHAVLTLWDIAGLEASQKILRESLTVAREFKTALERDKVSGFILRMACRSEIGLCLKVGEVFRARELAETLETDAQTLWRRREQLSINRLLLNVFSRWYDTRRVKKYREYISSHRREEAVEVTLLRSFFYAEDFEVFLAQWESVKSRFVRLRPHLIIPLFEYYFLIASQTIAEEEIKNEFRLLNAVLKTQPHLAGLIEMVRKKVEPFLRLYEKDTVAALKLFEKNIFNNPTLNEFDKANYAQLFSRAAIKRGHRPKDFSLLVAMSLKTFEKFGMEARTILIAEKLYDGKLIVKKEFERIRKKYHTPQDVFLPEKENAQKVFDVQTSGIFLHTFGQIKAVGPDGKEIISRQWGKRKSGPSHHKRIVLELVRAHLENRPLTRKELFETLFPEMRNGVSKKKHEKNDWFLSILLSQLKKAFAPHKLFERTKEGYRLHESVRIDITEAKNFITQAKAVETLHPPSAAWLLSKAYETISKGEFAEGFRGDGLKKIREEVTRLRSDLSSSLKHPGGKL